MGSVLSWFGKQKKAGRRHYRSFIQEGQGQGKRPELTGGGLLRSAGGWGVLKFMRRMKERLKGDERILGDSDFVMQVLESAKEQMEERYRLSAEGHTFEGITTQVSEHFGLCVEERLSPGKHPHRVNARM